MMNKTWNIRDQPRESLERQGEKKNKEMEKKKKIKKKKRNNKNNIIE